MRLLILNMDPQPTSQASSVWHYKPWWCQPWSILLTGIIIIGGSWFLFRAIWISLAISIPTLIWMVFFLMVYPRLFAQAMSAEIQKQL